MDKSSRTTTVIRADTNPNEHLELNLIIKEVFFNKAGKYFLRISLTSEKSPHLLSDVEVNIGQSSVYRSYKGATSQLIDWSNQNPSSKSISNFSDSFTYKFPKGVNAIDLERHVGLKLEAVMVEKNGEFLDDPETIAQVVLRHGEHNLQMNKDEVKKVELLLHTEQRNIHTLFGRVFYNTSLKVHANPNNFRSDNFFQRTRNVTSSISSSGASSKSIQSIHQFRTPITPCTTPCSSQFAILGSQPCSRSTIRDFHPEPMESELSSEERRDGFRLTKHGSIPSKLSSQIAQHFTRPVTKSVSSASNSQEISAPTLSTTTEEDQVLNHHIDSKLEKDERNSCDKSKKVSWMDEALLVHSSETQENGPERGEYVTHENSKHIDDEKSSQKPSEFVAYKAPNNLEDLIEKLYYVPSGSERCRKSDPTPNASTDKRMADSVQDYVKFWQDVSEDKDTNESFICSSANLMARTKQLLDEVLMVDCENGERHKVKATEITPSGSVDDKSKDSAKKKKPRGNKATNNLKIAKEIENISKDSMKKTKSSGNKLKESLKLKKIKSTGNKSRESLTLKKTTSSDNESNHRPPKKTKSQICASCCCPPEICFEDRWSESGDNISQDSLEIYALAESKTAGRKIIEPTEFKTSQPNLKPTKSIASETYGNCTPTVCLGSDFESNYSPAFNCFPDESADKDSQDSLKITKSTTAATADSLNTFESPEEKSQDSLKITKSASNGTSDILKTFESAGENSQDSLKITKSKEHGATGNLKPTKSVASETYDNCTPAVLFECDYFQTINFFPDESAEKDSQNSWKTIESAEEKSQDSLKITKSVENNSQDSLKIAKNIICITKTKSSPEEQQTSACASNNVEKTEKKIASCDQVRLLIEEGMVSDSSHEVASLSLNTSRGELNQRADICARNDLRVIKEIVEYGCVVGDNDNNYRNRFEICLDMAENDSHDSIYQDTLDHLEEVAPSDEGVDLMYRENMANISAISLSTQPVLSVTQQRPQNTTVAIATKSTVVEALQTDDVIVIPVSDRMPCVSLPSRFMLLDSHSTGSKGQLYVTHAHESSPGACLACELQKAKVLEISRRGGENIGYLQCFDACDAAVYGGSDSLLVGMFDMAKKNNVVLANDAGRHQVEKPKESFDIAKSNEVLSNNSGKHQVEKTKENFCFINRKNQVENENKQVEKETSDKGNTNKSNENVDIAQKHKAADNSGKHPVEEIFCVVNGKNQVENENKQIEKETSDKVNKNKTNENVDIAQKHEVLVANNSGKHHVEKPVKKQKDNFDIVNDKNQVEKENKQIEKESADKVNKKMPIENLINTASTITKVESEDKQIWELKEPADKVNKDKLTVRVISRRKDIMSKTCSQEENDNSLKISDLPKTKSDFTAQNKNLLKGSCNQLGKRKNLRKERSEQIQPVKSMNLRKEKSLDLPTTSSQLLKPRRFSFDVDGVQNKDFLRHIGDVSVVQNTNALHQHYSNEFYSRWPKKSADVVTIEEKRTYAQVKALMEIEANFERDVRQRIREKQLQAKTEKRRRSLDRDGEPIRKARRRVLHDENGRDRSLKKSRHPKDVVIKHRNLADHTVVKYHKEKRTRHRSNSIPKPDNQKPPSKYLTPAETDKAQRVALEKLNDILSNDRKRRLANEIKEKQRENSNVSFEIVEKEGSSGSFEIVEKIKDPKIHSSTLGYQPGPKYQDSSPRVNESSKKYSSRSGDMRKPSVILPRMKAIPRSNGRRQGTIDEDLKTMENIKRRSSVILRELQRFRTKGERERAHKIR